MMKLYFVTQKNMGESVILKPRKPISASEEEGNQPRICTSTSILGALSSIGRNLGLGCNTHIYMCDSEGIKIVQPNRVADVDITGEVWVLQECEFYLHKIIKLTSVKSFCIDTEKEIEIFHFEFEIVND